MLLAVTQDLIMNCFQQHDCLYHKQSNFEECYIRLHYFSIHFIIFNAKYLNLCTCLILDITSLSKLTTFVKELVFLLLQLLNFPNELIMTLFATNIRRTMIIIRMIILLLYSVYFSCSCNWSLAITLTARQYSLCLCSNFCTFCNVLCL